MLQQRFKAYKQQKKREKGNQFSRLTNYILMLERKRKKNKHNSKKWITGGNVFRATCGLTFNLMLNYFAPIHLQSFKYATYTSCNGYKLHTEISIVAIGCRLQPIDKGQRFDASNALLRGWPLDACKRQAHVIGLVTQRQFEGLQAC